jgi:hypothetical protein
MTTENYHNRFCLTIEASIHDIPMPWVLTELNEENERVSEERGTFRPGVVNLDENGDEYDMEDLWQLAAEVYECDCLASRRNERKVK